MYCFWFVHGSFSLSLPTVAWNFACGVCSMGDAFVFATSLGYMQWKRIVIDSYWGLHHSGLFCHAFSSRAEVQGRQCLTGPCSLPQGSPWSCLELVLSKAQAVGSWRLEFLRMFVLALTQSAFAPRPLFSSPYCLNSNMCRPTWRIPPQLLLKLNARP